MNKYIGIILEAIKINEMTTFHKNLTNIDTNIWVDDMGSERQIPHHLPRIKFEDSPGRFIPISIEDKPKILKKIKLVSNNYKIGQVKNFIKRNKDSLLKHWYNKITTDELKKLIKKV